MAFNDFFSIHICVIYGSATVVDKKLHSLMNTAFVSSNLKETIVWEWQTLQWHFEYIDFQNFFLCNIIYYQPSKTSPINTILRGLISVLPLYTAFARVLNWCNCSCPWALIMCLLLLSGAYPMCLMRELLTCLCHSSWLGRELLESRD